MKKSTFSIAILAGLMLTASSCKKWLDVNQDPDTPQSPGVASVFPTQLAAISRGVQWDGRYLGKIIQNWVTNTGRAATEFTWDKHGYVSASDAGGDIWRMTYYGMARNLDYIIKVGEENRQWDYVGAAWALKAYSFQMVTDYSGEAIFSEAFKDEGTSFKYDTQEEIYMGVRRYCDSAIKYLDKTDYESTTVRLKTTDYVYDGDVTKWKKFVYGLLARNYNNLSNKAGFDPMVVVDYVNKAMASNSDDFLLPFDGTKTDDSNFFGPSRDNLTHFRQSAFIVGLLDGSILVGNRDSASRDPRLPHMLSASKDTSGTKNGGYNGGIPGTGDPNTGNKVIAQMWQDSTTGNPRISGVFIPTLGKYIFRDKAVEPVMTYAEMQFIKAEALYRSNTDMVGAHTAYKAGIKAHFDFINRTVFPRGNVAVFNTRAIPAVEVNGYLNGVAVEQNPNDLRLSDIMLQKYIALWGWGLLETWTDLRKNHYNLDLDPVYNDLPVYNAWTPPATLETSNQGKLAYRVRPRFNSEYVWNVDALIPIGGMNGDYHTYEMWFSKP